MGTFIILNFLLFSLCLSKCVLHKLLRFLFEFISLSFGIVPMSFFLFNVWCVVRDCIFYFSFCSFCYCLLIENYSLFRLEMYVSLVLGTDPFCSALFWCSLLLLLIRFFSWSYHWYDAFPLLSAHFHIVFAFLNGFTNIMITLFIGSFWHSTYIFKLWFLSCVLCAFDTTGAVVIVSNTSNGV